MRDGSYGRGGAADERHDYVPGLEEVSGIRDSLGWMWLRLGVRGLLGRGS